MRLIFLYPPASFTSCGHKQCRHLSNELW